MTDQGPQLRRLTAAKNRLWRYLRVLAGLAFDAVSRFKGLCLFLVGSNVMSFLFQIAALSLTVWYIRALQVSDEVVILGKVFEPRHSLGLLIFVALSALLALLGTTVLGYLSGTSEIRFRRLYGVHAAQRALVRLSQSNVVWAPPDQDFATDADVIRASRMDSRVSGIVATKLIRSIDPMIIFVFSLAALLYIDWMLTSIFVLLLAGATAFLYRTTIGGARATKRLEETSPGASKIYREALGRARGVPSPFPDDDRWLEERVFADPVMRDYLDAFEGRLRAAEHSRLITGVVYAVALIVAFGGIGSRMLVGQASWEHLVAYLAALRFAQTSVQTLAQRLTFINRFYPKVARYHDFMHRTRSAGSRRLTGRLKLHMTVDDPQVPGTLTAVEVGPGSSLAIVAQLAVSRYSLAWLMRAVFGRQRTRALGAAWFVTADYGCIPNCTLLELLAFPPAYTATQLRSGLRKLGADQLLQAQLGEDLTQTISSEVWRKLDPTARFALASVRAIVSDAQIIVMEGQALRHLPEDGRRALLEQLSDRLLIFVHNRKADRPGEFGEGVVGVIADQHLVGLGDVDWYQRNREQLEQIVRPSAVAGSVADDELDELDEELM